MSAQANYFKLGLFVIVSTFLLVAGVIVLGAGKLFQKTVYVETYMAESVEGLTLGSAVKYQGVQIGAVSEITFASYKYEPDFFAKGLTEGMVLVGIALDANTFRGISGEQWLAWLAKAREAGLRLRVASSGIAGPAYLEAVYLDPGRYPVAQVRWTPPESYIPSAPSTTQVLVRSVEAIARKLAATDFDTLVSNVDVLVRDLDRALEQVDVAKLNTDAVQLLEDVRSLADDLGAKQINEGVTALVDELRASNARLKQILDDPDVEPSIADVRATLENARNATARLDQILHDPLVQNVIEGLAATGEELPPAMLDLRRAARNIDRLVATQQATVEAILAELQHALESVDSLTEDASRNPSRLLFGEPPERATPGGDR